MAAIPMNKYMTPEDIANMQELAGIDDPDARIAAYGGMQRMASNMGQYKAPQERSNGRVVGLTSPLEGLGAMGQQLAGAYMNKGLMDKYGSILDQNNLDRRNAASKIGSRYLVNALRGPAAQSFPVANQNPAVTSDLPYEMDY